MATQQPTEAIDSEAWIAKGYSGECSRGGPTNTCAVEVRDSSTGGFRRRISASGIMVANVNRPYINAVWRQPTATIRW